MVKIDKKTIKQDIWDLIGLSGYVSIKIYDISDEDMNKVHMLYDNYVFDEVSYDYMKRNCTISMHTKPLSMNLNEYLDKLGEIENDFSKIY